MRRALPAASLILFSLALPAAAREELPAETRYAPFSGVVSTCETPGVLSTIQSRFASTERRYWSSQAEIIGFEKVRQSGLRTSGLDLIPRRNCEAVAVMAGGKKLRLRYSIIEKYGFSGHFEGVSYCLAGFDRNLTAAGDCSRFSR
ncbi:MAG: hypothetical protein ACRDBL_02060 [Rhabdaerophilum sp.]